MRYLLSSSCLVILLSCASVYKNLQPGKGSFSDLQKFKPAFSVALYKADVDVVGNHLSGLLLMKRMPDSSMRLVFSNEMGFKFFDFEFAKDGAFKVFSITPKMNKKAVIKTLRKDFELVLMENLDSAKMQVRTDSSLVYYTFPQTKGFYHYITNTRVDKLIRMERASKRKPVVQVIAQNYINGIPDTIGFTHTKFNFTIGLKRLER
ncbi:MAG: hypothetical protein ABIN67_00400 [Ferruginibacter sp.]